MYMSYDVYFAFVEEFQPQRFKELARDGYDAVRNSINKNVAEYNQKMNVLLERGLTAGQARDIVNEEYFVPEELCRI